MVLTRGGVSQTILANVKVLALGTRLGQVNTSTRKDAEKSNAAEVSTFSGNTIATLELAPSQGELIINATKLGTLSLVLRSIADFAQTDADALRNETSRAVRMIRFGNAASVMPSDNGAATVSAAAFEEPAPDDYEMDEDIAYEDEEPQE